MSHPIISGATYRVVTVNGLAPATLPDFIGAVELVLAYQQDELPVLGLGVLDHDTVRLTEKSGDVGGKDVRTWRIFEDPPGFGARHDPAH